MSETEFALGTHCGVTFAGLKAASLFRLGVGCLSDLAEYESHFQARGFRFVCLKEGKERRLMYVYHCEELQKILCAADVCDFLKERGYRYAAAEEAVEQLKKRFCGEEFPHEVGVFLGYPLEDVKSFISHPKDGVKLVGYWKVYGNEEQSRRLFERYDRCTQKIRRLLTGGKTLEAIFSR